VAQGGRGEREREQGGEVDGEGNNDCGAVQGEGEFLDVEAEHTQHTLLTQQKYTTASTNIQEVGDSVDTLALGALDRVVSPSSLDKLIKAEHSFS